MRKTLGGSLFVLALITRPALAQGTSGSHGFIGENIKPMAGASVTAPSSFDWTQTAESKAQSKWKKGGFGKKGKPGAKKPVGKSRRPAPPRRKP